MTDRIRITDLRRDCLDPTFDPHEPVVVNPAELAALLDVAQAAHEAAKTSHVQNTDPDRMNDAWDALDDALNRFDFT